MYEIECTYTGLVPGMHDKFFNPEELEGSVKKNKKTAWKTELPLKLHTGPKGVCIPADNIRMMIIGNKLRMGAAKILGSHIETKLGSQYLAFAKACVWIVGKDDPLRIYYEPKRKTPKTWEACVNYDERSFVNAVSSRSLTRRPLITLPWSLTFRVQVTGEELGESKVREMFEVAGLRCGCGAYGPTFGRCQVTQWDVITK